MKILSIVSFVLGLSCAVSNVFADMSRAAASAGHNDVHEAFKAKAAEMSKRHQQEINDVVNKKSKPSQDAQNKIMKDWKEWRATYLEIPGHTVNDDAYKTEQKKMQAAIHKVMVSNPGINANADLGLLTQKHREEQAALQKKYDEALAKHNARQAK